MVERRKSIECHGTLAIPRWLRNKEYAPRIPRDRWIQLVVDKKPKAEKVEDVISYM